MTLKQAMDDKKAAAAKNDGVLQHWQREHDKLRLVDVEYELQLCLRRNFDADFLLKSSDEEDEDGDAEGKKEAQDDAETAEDPSSHGPKPEPEEPSLKNGKTDMHGLHIYTVTELSTFDQKELVADSELLDGAFFSIQSFPLLMRSCRETEEPQAQSKRFERLP